MDSSGPAARPGRSRPKAERRTSSSGLAPGKKVEKKCLGREGTGGRWTFNKCEALKASPLHGDSPVSDSPDKVGIPGASHVPLTSWLAPLYWLRERARAPDLAGGGRSFFVLDLRRTAGPPAGRARVAATVRRGGCPRHRRRCCPRACCPGSPSPRPSTSCRRSGT